MAGYRALLLHLPGLVHSSLYACLYAFELTFACYCHREVFQSWELDLVIWKAWEGQVEPEIGQVQASTLPVD